MKIALAQYQSIKGDIAANVKKHLVFLEESSKHRVDLVVFPELSLSGYEPTLAKELAMELTDDRLEPFQVFSNTKNVTVLAGFPGFSSKGTCISLAIFQPHQPAIRYSKRYLHEDEWPYFVSGDKSPILLVNGIKIGLTICYELSVAEHNALLAQSNIDLYLASVAKTTNGMLTASRTLSSFAQTQGVPVAVVNSVGPADNFVASGGSSAWDQQGSKIMELGQAEEGLMLLDTHHMLAEVISMPGV